MHFWNKKKSSVVAVLPAASREAGRVITSEEIPVSPAQRRTNLLRAFNVNANAGEPRKSSLPAHSTVTPANKIDRTWISIILLGTLLLINGGVNIWLLCKADYKDPIGLNQKIQLDQTREDLAQMRITDESFLRNSNIRMRNLQSDIDNARDHLQILEHENRQALRAYQKPPIYGLNGVVTQTEVRQ